MMRRVYAAVREHDEAGSSVIMFVMALPLLVVFLCALIDFGRVVFVQMAIDDAAQAACRQACENTSAGKSASAAQAAAERVVSEALRGEAAATSVQVRARVGDAERVEYVRRRYSPQAREFAEVSAGVDSRKVEVSVKADVASLTPIGSAAARAVGTDGRFRVESQAAGVAWVAQKG